MRSIAPDCSTEDTQQNGCRVHIQEGTTCSDAGDHCYDREDDPWVNIQCNFNSVCMSREWIQMVGGNGCNPMQWLSMLLMGHAFHAGYSILIKVEASPTMLMLKRHHSRCSEVLSFLLACGCSFLFYPPKIRK